MIPNRIYHIWLSDQPESQLAQHCVRTWHRLGSNVEIVHVTLENVEQWCVSPIMATFLSQGKIGRVKANDYLRVRLLYEHGGWYMDNDVEVLRPFSDLGGIGSGCVFAAEDNEQVNFAVLGGQEGNEFLREVLELMEARVDEPNPVKFSLGAATEVARRHGWSGNREHRLGGDVRILHSSAFFPYSWRETYAPAKVSERAYAVHYWGHSWGGPLVSIVIPCYQHAQYLPEAIESALAQSWGHKEVIVVNDGSPDNTSEIARRYPVRLVEQANRGLSGARNAGIRVADGEYIICLDADDRLAPRCVEECVDKGDIVCPGQQEFEGSHAFYIRKPFDFSLRSFLKANWIHCASMFRRAAWERVGGYDESMLFGFEDWEFWIRMVAAGEKVVAVDEPLFFYRVHDSMTRRVTLPKAPEIIAYMRTKHAALHAAAAKA